MEIKEEYSQLIKIAGGDFQHFKFLPFAVYITHSSGTILEFNDDAAHLLDLTTERKGTININQFYLQSLERTRLIKKLSNFPHGQWEKNQTLNFRVNNKKLSLRYFAKAYKDENGHFLGSLCLVFQITDFERFRYLEDNMQIGFFEINADSTITYANNKFREIFGVDSTDDMKMTKFLPNEKSQESFLELIGSLKKDTVIKEKTIDFLKSDKTPVIGKIHLVRDELDEGDSILKIQGTMEDITFSDILENVPIGLFSLIRRGNGDFQLANCNNHFLEVFAIDDVKKCIGKNLKDLLRNDIEFQILAGKINNLTDEEDLLQNYPIKSGTHPEKDLILHIKKAQPRNHTLRYAAALFDVTDDVERRLAGWKQDFASFLHTYSATSNSIRETIQSIIETHGTDVVRNNRVNTDHAFQMIRNHINGFRTNFQKYVEGIDKKLDHSRIFEMVDAAKASTDSMTKLNLANIRNYFLRIRTQIESQRTQIHISKEISRGISNDISEIFRFLKLLNLHFIEQEIYEMGLDTEEFKELLRWGIYKGAETSFDAQVEIANAIQNLGELAGRKNIEVRVMSSHNQVMITGHRRSLYTVFYNVLLNAIKYSWVKPDEKKSWVTIQISYTKDHSNVLFKFRNRGVGITKADIESGRLFEFGNRGKTSSDRDRRGNGIGLWHSKKLIHQYDGDITITSEPINFNSEKDLKSPFLTEVTIKIPNK